MRLRVTNTQIDYEGSITIGRKLLNGLLDGEKVTIHNQSNGEQFDTYVIAGDKELWERVSEIIYGGGEYGWQVEEAEAKADQILDLCEEGVCVNGAAARLVQVGDIIEVNGKEGL